MPISQLELSVGSANCLQEAKIGTIAELVSLTEQELLQHRNFGKKSLNELADILKNMDLSFGMVFSDEVKERLKQETGGNEAS